MSNTAEDKEKGVVPFEVNLDFSMKVLFGKINFL
jgi:hypothetical protein